MEHKTLYTVAGLCAIAACAGAFFWYTSQHNSAKQILDDAHSGNYEDALQRADNLQASPVASADEKARASILSSSLAYELSGNIDDALQSVRQLKTIAADPAVSTDVRAAAEVAVALWFQNSGDSKAVYDEIFKDEPYRSNLDPNNNASSIRNLLLSVYTGSPSGHLASTIAGNYVKSAFSLQKGINPSIKNGYLDEGQKYLTEATTLGLTTDKTSQAYVSDRYWEAYAYGGLAFFRGDPYKKEYAQKYQELETFIRTGGTYDQKRWLALILWREGAVFRMIVDEDNAGASAKFAEAVQAVTDSQTPQSNVLTSLVRYFKIHKAAGSHSWGVRNFTLATEISPEFKAFADGIK